MEKIVVLHSFKNRFENIESNTLLLVFYTFKPTLVCALQFVRFFLVRFVIICNYLLLIITIVSYAYIFIQHT